MFVDDGAPFAKEFICTEFPAGNHEPKNDKCKMVLPKLHTNAQINDKKAKTKKEERRKKKDIERQRKRLL
jgi:hypothetical protein